MKAQAQDGMKPRSPRSPTVKFPFTEARIKALKPPPDGPATVWDSQVAHLACRVGRTGVKTFAVFRRIQGKPEMVKIDRWPSCSVAKAREQAEKLNGAVAEGAKPAEARRAARGAPTVDELVERFLAEHAATKIKSSSAAEYKRVCEQFIIPELDKRTVPEVTRADVSRLHHKMKATPYQANRVLATMSTMFNLSERWGMRSDNSNPCRHLGRFKERKRERFLSEVELSRLGAALTELEHAGKKSPFSVAAIRLLIFTGARRSEILALRWEHVDLEAGVLRLPDSKTGAKTIHLNAPAVHLLENLPRVKDNPHVIPGWKKGTCLTNLGAPWRRIRSVAELPDLRIHDLRHSFASVAVTGGLSLPVIGALLRHTQPSTTQRYAHLSADPLKKAAELIGEKIAGLMNGPAQDAAPVVPIRKGKRHAQKP